MSDKAKKTSPRKARTKKPPGIKGPAELRADAAPPATAAIADTALHLAAELEQLRRDFMALRADHKKLQREHLQATAQKPAPDSERARCADVVRQLERRCRGGGGHQIGLADLRAALRAIECSE